MAEGVNDGSGVGDVVAVDGISVVVLVNVREEIEARISWEGVDEGVEISGEVEHPPNRKVIMSRKIIIV